MKELISVILPVYNAEEYICRCIESVIAQTYRPIELIIIDDGSSDGTFSILENMRNKYPNIITVLSQRNLGVSIARNKGIAGAKGEYLSFIDSDDQYQSDYLEKALRLLKKYHSEMTIAPFSLLADMKTTNDVNYLPNKGSCISVREYLDVMYSYHDEAFWGANWNKVYIADIIREFHIEFQEGVSIGEDFYFNLQYLQHVNSITIISESSYYYRVDTVGSISKQKRNPKDYWNQYVLLYNACQKLNETKCNEENNLLIERFAQIMARHTLYMARVTNGCKFMEFSELFQVIRESKVVFGKKAKTDWRTAVLVFCLRTGIAHMAYLALSSEKVAIKYLRRNNNV